MKHSSTKAILIGSVITLFVLAACAGGQTPAEQASQPTAAQPPQLQKIDVNQLAGMLDNKDFTFVNVHIPYEGEIANTDLQIPFDEIATHLDKLPDKSAKIVLYCKSGRMSNEASQKLVELGYTDVYDVLGGMNAWKESGRQVIQK